MNPLADAAERRGRSGAGTPVDPVGRRQRPRRRGERRRRSLHALYELAARDDCVVDEIIANALVVILPTQNPDGREIGQRRNINGFDMNRDWFARTQPETDGKLEVVSEYPPMFFIDAHEFGLANYFFPPNADPIYHEIPDQAHDWINELYSPAIVDASSTGRASSSSTARRTTSSRSSSATPSRRPATTPQA